MAPSPEDVAGEKAIEIDAAKAEPTNKSHPRREAAASTTCQHSYETGEACQAANEHGSHVVSRISKMKVFEERAKKMAEKYGLVIEASDFLNMAPSETVYRVDKPIRMRVRRAGHKCNTMSATRSECSICRHTRCDTCPRYSTKGSDMGNLQELEAVVKASRENPAILADFFWGDQQIELKRPSKTGGQDLVHRKPRQRIRRTCHECESLFTPGSRKCAFCDHDRCTDCPRDPPKKDKYPFGYPGDVFGPDTNARFECLSCETLYPAEAEDGTFCQTCGLEKSGESPRAIPRKIQPLPDPEVLCKLQATLDELISSS